MIDWKFIARKYWDKWRNPGPVAQKTEDGLIIQYLKQAKFPSPAEFNALGQETFDVALGLKGDAAIDIGAHVGSYCMRLAKNFRWVYAFEPNPVPLELLLRNLAVNNIQNVQVEQAAITDRDGWRTLRIPSKFLPGTTLSEKHYDWLPFDKELLVRGYSLDNYFKGLDCKVGFVKIDAEGHEVAVLNGMRRLIRNNPSMVLSVEIHKAPDTLTGCDCEACQWLKIEGLKTELHGRYTSDMQAHWIVAR